VTDVAALAGLAVAWRLLALLTLVVKSRREV
jgi:hypothetical protein